MNFSPDILKKDNVVEWFVNNYEKNSGKFALEVIVLLLTFIAGWLINYSMFPKVGWAEWLYYSLIVIFNYTVYSLINLVSKRWYFILSLLIVLLPVYVVTTQLFLNITDSLIPSSQYISIWRKILEEKDLKLLITKPMAYPFAFYYNASVLFFPFIIRFLFSEFLFKELNSKQSETNLRLELSFLQSQIHPHFLFNTINNIYGKTLKNKIATDILLSLSNFIRYKLYKPTHSFIPLTEELNAVKNYSFLLDSIFKREQSIKIYGEVSEEINIRPHTILNCLDVLMVFHSSELNESKRSIFIGSEEVKLVINLALIVPPVIDQFYELREQLEKRLIGLNICNHISTEIEISQKVISFNFSGIINLPDK
ncbi:histidine kinase [Jiulongibacter sp. NS-SX5]|uniref:histidine kinase n=1 Tax=Jiulongibacter sp. NS-SX5 TaxID=3463854 RepID=UPI00405A0B48